MGILYFVRVDDIYMLIGEFQSNKKLRKKIAGGLVKSWIITTFAGRLYPKTERIGARSLLLGRASLCVRM